MYTPALHAVCIGGHWLTKKEVGLECTELLTVDGPSKHFIGVIGLDHSSISPHSNFFGDVMDFSSPGH